MDFVNCCDITNKHCSFTDGPAREHCIVDALDNGDNITAKVHTTPNNHKKTKTQKNNSTKQTEIKMECCSEKQKTKEGKM